MGKELGLLESKESNWNWSRRGEVAYKDMQNTRQPDSTRTDPPHNPQFERVSRLGWTGNKLLFHGLGEVRIQFC